MNGQLFYVDTRRSPVDERVAIDYIQLRGMTKECPVAITFDLIRGGMVVLQYWSRKFPLNEVIAERHQQFTDPRITFGASTFLDAREALAGTTQEDVHNSVDGLYATHRQFPKIEKRALLVNDLTYPFHGRMSRA